MLTKDQIFEITRDSVVQATDDTTYTEAKVFPMIDIAYDKSWLDFQMVDKSSGEKHTTITVTDGTQPYELPDDFLQLLDISDSNVLPMRRTQPGSIAWGAYVAEINDDGNRTIRVTPEVQNITRTLYVKYVKKIPELEDGDATTIYPTISVDWLVIYYTAYLWFLSKGGTQTDEAVKRLNIYKDYLNELQSTWYTDQRAGNIRF